MRKIFYAIFILCLTICGVFADQNNPICINRNLNTSISLSVEDGVMDIKIEDSVRNVSFENIHGLDGLEIISSEVVTEKKDERYKIFFSYDLPVGQAFIVLNIEFEKKNNSSGIKSHEVITIPVGELSHEQIEERNSRIKFYQKTSVRDSGHNSINTPGIVVHELPIVEKD